jgi:hypothetical protein
MNTAVPVQIVDKDAIVQQQLVNYAAVGAIFPASRSLRAACENLARLRQLAGCLILLRDLICEMTSQTRAPKTLGIGNTHTVFAAAKLKWDFRHQLAARNVVYSAGPHSNK